MVIGMNLATIQRHENKKISLQLHFAGNLAYFLVRWGYSRCMYIFFPAPTRTDQSLGRPRFGLSQLRMANKRSQVVALALLSPFPSTPLSNCQVIGARRLPLHDEVPFSRLSRPTLHQIPSHPDFLIGKMKFHSLRWLFCTELSHSFR